MDKKLIFAGAFGLLFLGVLVWFLFFRKNPTTNTPIIQVGKKDDKTTRERAKLLLEMLNLGERTNHFPSQLSGGEQQRVAVARALINSPDIVLADEPSGNLDSKNAQELHHIFFDLREKFNQTFVIVTHNETLAKMADRTIVLQDGNIV